MLIRSQDKTAIINVDNAFNIAVRDINGTIVIHIGNSSSCCIIAEYSTKAKAMKVLDMIQDAYAEIYMLVNVFGNIGIMPLKNSDQNAFRNIKNDFQTKIVFHMPQDSEVESDR